MRFSIAWLCELFNVSRAGYYKWVKRKGILNQYQVQQGKIDSIVKRIYDKHSSLGYRAINALILERTMHKYCDLSILKSMQRLGIQSKARKKRYTRDGQEHKIFPNVLARKFNGTKPFEKIATDITQFRFKGKRYYFSCYLDLFNNEILEWDVKDMEDNLLVLKPLERLLKSKRMDTKAPLVLHSDQGKQYSSISFTSLLERYNITQSMSRTGNPRDNAVMESFFGWFKSILKYDFNYWKSDNLVEVIKDAVHYYNYERPSYALKYKNPVQYRIERGFE